MCLYRAGHLQLFEVFFSRIQNSFALHLLLSEFDGGRFAFIRPCPETA